jgi:hypothetical protein
MATYAVGSGKTYATIAAAWSAIPADVVSSAEIHEIIVDAGTYSGRINLSGKTTSADYYVIIRAATGDEHKGVYGAGVVITDDAGAGGVVNVDQNYTRLYDLEVVAGGSSNTRGFATDATGIQFYRCISRVSASATEDAFETATGASATYYSCIADGFGGDGFNLNNAATIKMYGCTAVNMGGNGFETSAFAGANGEVINCVAYNNTGSDFQTGGNTSANSNYNASEDGTAPGANSITLTGDPFVDSANDDYSIATTSALAGTGTNTRTLTTTAKDITGEDRIYWDIGAFAANTAASSYKTEFKVVPTAGTVPATQTDFPMLLDLSDASASFWSAVASGGGDIRVFDEQADGLVELPREVVSCDTTAETGEVWIKVPSLSSSADTVLQVHVDGSSSDYDPAADLFGRNEVWSDYGFVSHNGGITDSTGNNSPTNSGATTGATGKIGEAVEFNGSGGSSIDIGSDAAIDDVFSGGGTLSAWIKPDNAGESGFGRIFQTGNTDTTTGVAAFLRVESSTIRLTTASFYTGGNSQDYSNSAITAGSFEHIAFSFDNTSPSYTTSMYIGGGLSAVTRTSTGSGSFKSDASANKRIGNRSDNVREFDGVIDEVRLIKSALSANWITTEYANQSDPGNFYAATDPSAGGGTNYDVSVTFGSEGGVTMTGLVGFGADFTVDISAGIDSSALADASADFTAAAQADAVIESRADFLVSITTGAEAGQVMTGAVTAGGTVLASFLVSAEMGATATAEAQALASMLTSAQAGQVMTGSVDGVTNIEAAMLAGYDAGASAEAQADALAALLVSYGAGLSAFEDSSIPASMVLSAAADIGMTATIGAEVSFITAAETDAVISGQVDASAVIEVSTEAAATMIAGAASSAGIEVASIANIEIFASSFSGDIVTPEHRIYRVSFELRTFSVEPRVSTFTVQ